MVNLQIFERAALTEKGNLKKVPRRKNFTPKLNEIGEQGECAVAHVLQWGLNNGKRDIPILADLDPDKDYVVMTTKMLVERSKLQESEEKIIQDSGGIDILIIPKNVYDSGMWCVKIADVRAKLYKTVQVKLQPYAPRYRSITVETHHDSGYRTGKVLDLSDANIRQSGMNKNFADWTVYIVTANCMIWAPTEVYRELAQAKQPKYIGTPWYGNTKLDIGTTITLSALLSSPMAFTTGLGGVFRKYFSTIHSTANLRDHRSCSWGLFVQDWPVTTLNKYLGSGMTALQENEYRGNASISA